MAALQQPDGSFAGDEWGEIDTRCATLLLHMPHPLPSPPRPPASAALLYLSRCSCRQHQRKQHAAVTATFRVQAAVGAITSSVQLFSTHEGGNHVSSAAQTSLLPSWQANYRDQQPCSVLRASLTLVSPCSSIASGSLGGFRSLLSLHSYLPFSFLGVRAEAEARGCSAGSRIARC